MLQVKDLVSGRIDFHVHPGPDPFARVLDSYEMAWLAERYGMKAIVFKTSHYQGGCTAQILDSMFTKLHVVGGLCLENAVGGINPRAVEIAIQCGVKVIWMPFLDSTRNMELFSMDRSEMSPGDYSMVHDLAKTRSDQRGKKLNITVDGKLLPEVPEVLRIIAENDAVICSGHMNRRDRAIFVKAAKEAGCKKIVLTHVNALQAINDFDELDIWKHEDGIFVEYVFNPIVPYFSNQAPATLARMIRAVGPSKSVIGTDLGISQAFKGIAWPSPLEGMAAFVGLLMENGFSSNEIDLMSINNSSELLGI